MNDPLLGKKPENIILSLVNNTLKDLIEFKDFILKNLLSCKNITLSSPTVRIDNNEHKEKQ